MKKQSILAVALTALIVTGSAFAAKTTATPGYRIFNQSRGTNVATYTTSNPTGCTGVTFPTPVDSSDNAALTVTSGFTPGSVCSTQYTSSYTGGTCLVTISCDGVSGAVTMYATSIGAPCSAINGNTAVVLY